MGILLSNKTKKSRCQVTERKLLSQVSCATELSSDETGQDGRYKGGNLEVLSAAQYTIKMNRYSDVAREHGEQETEEKEDKLT